MPGKPSADRPLCRGTTATGRPCKNRAAAGSAYCSAHGGGKRRIGAPTKITPELVETIIYDVERGAYYQQAAAAAGIHVSTLKGWREQGEEDLDAGRDTPFAALVEGLTRASAQAELTMVQRIRAQAGEDWRAAAWWLERKAPERWARRDKLDVTADVLSKPRDVKPEGSDRDAILTLLGTALQPPAGDTT